MKNRNKKKKVRGERCTECERDLCALMQYLILGIVCSAFECKMLQYIFNVSSQIC